MGQEIASLRLNISQLASITGVHRQIVAARLKNVGPAVDSGNKFKLYFVTDVLSELTIPTVSTSNVEEMEPSDRFACWKAENEQLKFKVDTRQLIPAEGAAGEFSLTAKAVATMLETLPDILEHDCALVPTTVSRAQDAIDDLRDQVVQKVIDTEQGEEELRKDWWQNGHQPEVSARIPPVSCVPYVV